MSIFFLIFVFLFGLAVGSFLNVLIWRIPREEPIVASRSYCPNCKKTLEWRELIPLLSFAWQGGKCRSCHARISVQYPIVELATGILFVFVVARQFDNIAIGRFNSMTAWQFLDSAVSPLYLWFIVSVLVVIFVTDLRYYIIPDKITFPAIAVTLVYNFVHSLQSADYGLLFGAIRNGSIIHNSKFIILENGFISSFLAALFVSFFFLALVVASRGRWMGLGDVKFAFLMGLVLGFPNIFVALFLAFTLGSIVGILLIASGKKSFQSHLPFGTFLTLATFIALFWGNTLFNYYWNVIL